MSSHKIIFDFYDYAPLLAISQSEMQAIEQLPEKDKDKIIPIFPLKGWSSAKTLAKTMERIKKSIGERNFVADIDMSFILEKEKESKLKGEPPRDVVLELKKLVDPSDGYKNWTDFVTEHSNIIPVIQLFDTNHISLQVSKLAALERGLCLKFNMLYMGDAEVISLSNQVSTLYNGPILFIFDFGDIKRSFLDDIPQVSQLIKKCIQGFSYAKIALCSTSFPDSFSGVYHGEASIYERQAFRRLYRYFQDSQLIYSDHGSARANKASGGARVPPPRIDYPLKDEWKYIRVDFDDLNNSKSEKYVVYKKIANEVISSAYWNKNFLVWGTQQIELTSLGSEYGIYDQRKAAAVRINIHLYVQLHYNSPVAIEEIDSDDDWVD